MTKLLLDFEQIYCFGEVVFLEVVFWRGIFFIHVQKVKNQTEPTAALSG